VGVGKVWYNFCVEGFGRFSFANIKPLSITKRPPSTSMAKIDGGSMFSGEIMYSAKRINLFWSHVDKKSKDECWNWKLSTTRDGYGKTKIDHVVIAPHRVAYYLFYGVDPVGREIMHKCDNKLCCNPVHLVLGTHSDNMQDMIRKNRQGKVKRNRRKLNMEIAREIRKARLDGASTYKLSDLYGISRIHVRDIVNNRAWKDTPMSEPFPA
jgi:hypothetical protein